MSSTGATATVYVVGACSIGLRNLPGLADLPYRRGPDDRLRRASNRSRTRVASRARTPARATKTSRGHRRGDRRHAEALAVVRDLRDRRRAASHRAVSTATARSGTTCRGDRRAARRDREQPARSRGPRCRPEDPASRALSAATTRSSPPTVRTRRRRWPVQARRQRRHRPAGHIRLRGRPSSPGRAPAARRGHGHATRSRSPCWSWPAGRARPRASHRRRSTISHPRSSWRRASIQPHRSGLQYVKSDGDTPSARTGAA